MSAVNHIEIGGKTLVTARLVCQQFGRNSRTLYRWRKSPELKFPIPIEINGRLYFFKEELEAFKASCPRRPAQESVREDQQTICGFAPSRGEC